MKYFINTNLQAYDVPTQLVIVAEDGREYSADSKTADYEALADFLDPKKHGKVEVWAYHAKEWWDSFRDIFGLPKIYHELSNWHQELGSPTLPAPPVHPSPREQAVWNRDVWAFLNRYAGQVVGETEEEDEPPEAEPRRKKTARKK